MTVAHYVVRCKESYGLLEHKDTRALFDSFERALSRAEALAHNAQPSLLELYSAEGPRANLQKLTLSS